jgi:hypothetical protein
MLAKLTTKMQSLQSLGRGYTFAIACALEKKGLVELGHVRTMTGQTVWAAKRK